MSRLPDHGNALGPSARSWHAGWRGPALLGVGVLAVAAWSSQSPPVATALADPNSYTSAWSLRFGPASLVELLVALALAAWALQRADLLTRPMSLNRVDLMVVAGAAIVVVLQCVALARGLPDDRFLAFDVERLLLLAGGYAVTRACCAGPATARQLTWLVAGLLAAHAVWLVVVHGLLGSTQFGTASGRVAVLITEDSLLVLFPVLIGWGYLVDGLLSWRAALATIAFAAFAVIVNLQSLRRGAVIFTLLAILLRSASVPRRVAISAVAGLLLVGALLYGAGPLRAPVSSLVYTAESALGLKADNSTTQRSGEFAAFGDNVDGLDWIVGRGLGTTWNSTKPGPVELGSFGSAETEYVRIGWHAYGLDYLYKLGLLGCFALACLAIAVARSAQTARARMSREHGSLLWSLTLLFAIFGLFAFSNGRVAFFAGVTLALLGSLAMEGAQRDSSARA